MSRFEITVQRYTSSQEKCEEESMIQQCRKRKDDNDSWLNIVPSEKVKIKKCDELTDEFKRAGIGLCFDGKKRVILIVFHSIYYLSNLLFKLKRRLDQK